WKVQPRSLGRPVRPSQGRCRNRGLVQMVARDPARCVGDVHICKQLWRFLQPDGYPRAALELEHSVAAICEQLTTAGAPFDTAAAKRLQASWVARRAELEAQLRAQFPAVKNLNSRIQIAALLEARGWRPAKRTEKTRQPVTDDALLETL